MATWITTRCDGSRNTAGNALGFATDWGKELTVLLCRAFCSPVSSRWRIRWTIEYPSFQRDIRDCNILCLSETWFTTSVRDAAVTPSENFSVLRMDRTAEAGKSKGEGVCFMINKKCCDPRNISTLSRSCSPHLEHLSIICRPFYLPLEFSSIIVTAVYIPPQADIGLALSELHDALSSNINKHPDAAIIITGDFNKANLRQIMPNLYQCPTIW